MVVEALGLRDVLRAARTVQHHLGERIARDEVVVAAALRHQLACPDRTVRGAAVEEVGREVRASETFAAIAGAQGEGRALDAILAARGARIEHETGGGAALGDACLTEAEAEVEVERAGRLTRDALAALEHTSELRAALRVTGLAAQRKSAALLV